MGLELQNTKFTKLGIVMYIFQLAISIHAHSF